MKIEFSNFISECFLDKVVCFKRAQLNCETFRNLPTIVMIYIQKKQRSFADRDQVEWNSIHLTTYFTWNNGHICNTVGDIIFVTGRKEEPGLDGQFAYWYHVVIAKWLGSLSENICLWYNVSWFVSYIWHLSDYNTSMNFHFVLFYEH